MKSIFAQVSPYLPAQDAQSGGETQVICLYSPAGGTGTTTVAIGLAGALSKHNRRVLYLDAQPLQNSRVLLPGEGVMSPQFRALLLSDPQEAAAQLPGAVGHGSFHYLLPLDHVTTAYGVELKHYRQLLDPLRAAGLYDFVVVDCSSDFTQEKSRLLSACDRVVLVTGQSAPVCWKASALLQDINLQGKDRFLLFCNRYQPDRPDHSKDILAGRLGSAGYLELLEEEVCLDPEGLSAQPALDMLALRLL